MESDGVVQVVSRVAGPCYKKLVLSPSSTILMEKMSQPRVSLWATEEIDEDLQVDVNLAIGNYGQNGLYDDGTTTIYISISLLTLSLDSSTKDR